MSNSLEIFNLYLCEVELLGGSLLVNKQVYFSTEEVTSLYSIYKDFFKQIVFISDDEAIIVLQDNTAIILDII